MVKIHSSVALLFTLLFSCISARQYLECSCSASKRGYRANVLTELTQSRHALREFSKDLWDKHARVGSPNKKTVQKEVSAMAIKLWRACLSNWKHEECVNADTDLRICNTKNCVADSFCKYQPWNWVNVRDGRPTAGCHTSKVLSSEDANIIAGKPEKRTRTRPSNSPTPSPSTRAAIPIPTEEVKKVKPSPKANTPNNKFNNKNKNINASPTVTPTVTPTVAALSSATPFAVAVGISPSPSVSPGEPVNEGCVAIEHLEGFVLQHRQHLLRSVLCSNSFCATPNHAIIVDGEWTSMKRLCMSPWNCVRTVKLVNNLKVTANRRAVISDSIVVTPYDIRFPRWGVWLVQIAEIVFNTVGSSGIMAGVFALAAVIYKSQKHRQ